MLGFFEKNSEAYRRNAISLAKTEAIYFPSMGLLIGLSTLLTIMIGGIGVIHGEMNIGVIGEFIMYVLLLTFPVSAIGWTASMIQRAVTSQRRINEFLHTKPVIQNPELAEKHALKGNIVFKDVDFTYPHTGIHAIKNFTLEIKAGQKVAIIGKTGSGKSTIAQLLLRMYDPQRGMILYDGFPLKQIDLTALRSQVSYVPQDVFLFSDTVANNISFGGDSILDEKVFAAAKQAVIDTEIMQFPENYSTMVGERGVTLSGGQKQRFSISTTLINQPKIIFLDEPTTGLDPQARRNLWDLIKDIRGKGTTVILTTHYMDEAEQLCDRVAILDEGKIIAINSPDKLIDELVASGFERPKVTKSASLEDVFIHLTGKDYRED